MLEVAKSSFGGKRPNLVMQTSIIIFIKLRMFFGPLNKLFFHNPALIKPLLASFYIDPEFLEDHFPEFPYHGVNAGHFHVEFFIIEEESKGSIQISRMPFSIMVMLMRGIFILLIIASLKIVVVWLNFFVFKISQNNGLFLWD